MLSVFFVKILINIVSFLTSMNLFDIRGFFINFATKNS